MLGDVSRTVTGGQWWALTFGCGPGAQSGLLPDLIHKMVSEHSAPDHDDGLRRLPSCGWSRVGSGPSPSGLSGPLQRTSSDPALIAWVGREN